jgi:hypothetical protein
VVNGHNKLYTVSVFAIQLHAKQLYVVNKKNLILSIKKQKDTVEDPVIFRLAIFRFPGENQIMDPSVRFLLKEIKFK